MSNVKKEVIVILLLVFGLVLALNTVADELGCCTNPGAGALACSADRLALRDQECCPKPESSFPTYYTSAQNPDNPLNANDCAANFFFINRACSAVNVCSLGCCCSELGGTITPAAQCKGTGLDFYEGETDCEQICPTAECSDGIDNDNNGCADFENGDTGCTSPADSGESGGSCITQGVGCVNPSYVPKLSNFEITPVKGQKKFLLKWKDECSETAVSYDILRCKGAGCTNFDMISTSNVNSFEDSTNELLFDTEYTYQVKAHYNLQAATPAITKSATLGNLECLDQFYSNNFCIHESYYNKYKGYLLANFPDVFRNFEDGVQKQFSGKLNGAFSCDAFNKLIPEGTSCPSSKICVVTNNQPSCLNKANCNYDKANPFGLYYTLQDCETERYCFYDRSHSTIDSCFSCDPSMSCYDYRTEAACGRDNCRIGNCKWKNLANQIGIGACIKENEYNCQWCESKGTKSLENLRAFNEIFDLCTKDKSNLLSEGAFKCYYRNGKSSNCNNVVCRDYDPGQCSSVQITHDQNNRITNPSPDQCAMGVCQNINNMCVKNADGDDKADCDTRTCETDYFAPNTTLTPLIKKGVVDSLVVQVYDKTSSNSSIILKTGGNYTTFLCVEPCGLQGHPYNASTKSKKIILSNLNAFDGDNGNRLLYLKEGLNMIRYYSQDPAKNIGEVKKITVETYGNTTGPKILSIEITNGSQVQDRLFTNNQKPTITIRFVEPAIITYARLINKNTGLIVQLNGNSNLNAVVLLPVAQTLPNGEYTFELNAKNKENIFMDPLFSAVVVIDNINPGLSITPPNGAVINTSIVPINLNFDKEVNLGAVIINSEDITGLFSTIDNMEFTAAVNLTDGNKKLDASASDFARNQGAGSVEFIVDAYATAITLVKPKFGISPTSIFDLVIGTDNNAECRYSLDNNFEFEFMDRFASTGTNLHSVPNFNKIPSGDTTVHKLNVKCKDTRYGISSKSFDINVDTTPPQLKSAYAYPNPIIEMPHTTTLTAEADEPVVCKFSSTTQEFSAMEGKFSGFDDNNFKLISKEEITLESEGDYIYYIACKNKAELNSDVKSVPIKVDLSIPMSITSHTPEFFNSTNVVLALETNKKSQCKFSEADATAQSGEIIGAPGYSHTRQLSVAPGKHTFYIICKDQFLEQFSGVATITFTVDITPPVILSVDDSSTLKDNPEFTWDTDTLRVRWESVDNESRVSSHIYALIESVTSGIILNWTTSYKNDEWVIVTNANKTGLEIVNGNSYFFRVQAKNIVGLSSDASDSNGITIDTSLKPLNCTNGIKNDEETDIDCGGSCGLCELGKICGINSDCKTNFCNNNICSAPKCDDTIKNADESDIDCGGACKKCQNNKVCNVNNDCESGFCSFGFCKPQEMCSDGKLSPGESDIDCGGPCPSKCPEGKSCGTSEDCAGDLQCVSSLCKKCEANDENCNGTPDDEESPDEGKDTDGDGLPDKWEIENGLNPTDPNDAGADSDNDGLTNIEEFELKNTYGKSTDPNLADTDNDGFDDKKEVDKGTSPVDPEDFPKSSLLKTFLFIFGALVLLSGVGYLAYRIKEKNMEEFEMPRRSMQMPRALPPMQQAPMRQRQGAAVSNILRKREEDKEKERKKIFESFGKEAPKEESTKKPEPKENKAVSEKEEKSEKPEKQEKKPAEQKKKSSHKKPEDIFAKLKEMAEDKRDKKPQKQKNAKK